jgi:hypothetical protein
MEIRDIQPVRNLVAYFVPNTLMMLWRLQIHLHQRCSIILGSKLDVEDAESFYT